MHEALILIARASAFAHDHWRECVGRRQALSGKIAVPQEHVPRLEAEGAQFPHRGLRPLAPGSPRRAPSRRRPGSSVPASAWRRHHDGAVPCRRG